MGSFRFSQGKLAGTEHGQWKAMMDGNGWQRMATYGNEWQWIAKYLGMRHAFFKVNEEKHCLHFYELCLKIDSANVKFKNLNCSNRELF